jgi:hypothetical protein
MALTTSLNTFSIAFEYDPYYFTTPTSKVKWLIGGFNVAVNQISSDANSDILTGLRYPGTGINLLSGNAGNDTLYSNAFGISFLQGSSNYTLNNGEVDILIGSSSAADHFIMSRQYKGSGFAIIKRFELNADSLYFSKGLGGDSLRVWPFTTPVTVTTGLTFKQGYFNNYLSTFISDSKGDLLAVLENTATNGEMLLNNGSLRFTV